MPASNSPQSVDFSKIAMKAPAPSQVTTQQMANAIRTKYPNAYQDKSDRELVNAWVKKYPVYQSRLSDYNQPSLHDLQQNLELAPGRALGVAEKVGGALAHNEVGFGQSIADALAAPAVQKETSTSNSALQQEEQKVLDTIHQKLVNGENINDEDVSRLVNSLKSAQSGITNDSDVLPSLNKSNAQIVGEALGTAADIAGGGSFTHIGEMGQAKLLPMMAEGAGLGYSQDVSQHLQNDDENPLMPGLGTIIGSAAPGVFKGAPLAMGAIKNTTGKMGEELSPIVTRLANGPSAEDAQRAAGQIVQGTPKEARIAAQALPTVDTQGVKTYKDLSTKLGAAIKQKLKTVDQEFGNDTTPRKISDLAQTVSTDVGGKTLTAKVNYVSNALKQLGELYNKTNDIEAALRIKGLTQKAAKEGLTPTEINELAKEYGSNFKAKGFSKTGEPLTSVNDRAYENTRSGLKETARGFLQSDTAKIADKEASDLIKTKDLADKMAEKVNALEQRIKPRNVVEKISRAAGHAVDLATFGGPRAFITKLLFPSGVGVKQMTSLDIQEALAKNLKTLNSVGKAPDNTLAKILGGLLKK